MWQRARAWQRRLPYNDALEQQQAALLQTMELSLIGVALLLIPISLVSVRTLAAQIFMNGLVVLIAVAALGGVVLLRRGRLRASAMLTAMSLVVGLSIMLFGNGLRDGGLILFAFALPLTIGGMLAGRRGLLLTWSASVIGVATAGLLEWADVPGAGVIANPLETPIPSILAFVLLAGLLGIFIASVQTLASDALATRRARERELEGLSRRLELAVRERTADLEIALSALQQRATQAEQLLAENAQQRDAIRAISVPVLPVDGRTLILPLVGELDAPRLDALQTRALDGVQQFKARRLILDITGVPLVDSQVARGILRVLRATRLLGAEVVLVGVRPEVAQSLVALGLDLADLTAFADLQSALLTTTHPPALVR